MLMNSVAVVSAEFFSLLLLYCICPFL